MSREVSLQDNEILLEKLDSEDPEFSYPFAEAAHAISVNTHLADTQELIVADVKKLQSTHGKDTYVTTRKTPIGKVVVLQYPYHHALEHRYSLCHCDVSGLRRSTPW
ncbi:hypothetical protein ABZ234_03465 [Nocardiopsis sp. NPDC006198]|uniref:hypothetical protein n=1 Tax=Nocardiopsis sp. NPDC006198 TaxID=3154472 RepID=UPI0033ABEB64